MTRPCFLIVDREHSTSISTRKLVIETAKFNVITAYSAREALETFAIFPAVSGVVLDSSVKDMTCGDVVAKLKSAAPGLPVIIVRGPGGQSCEGADHYLDSFEPALLLGMLSRLRPRETAEIEARNEELNRLGE
jgi:DNA-binding NtrC family response regulator